MGFCCCCFVLFIPLAQPPGQLSLGTDLLNPFLTAAGKCRLHPVASLVAAFGTCSCHV